MNIDQQYCTCFSWFILLGKIRLFLFTLILLLHSTTTTSLVWTSAQQGSPGWSQQTLPQGVVQLTMLSTYSMKHCDKANTNVICAKTQGCRWYTYLIVCELLLSCWKHLQRIWKCAHTTSMPSASHLRNWPMRCASSFPD